MACRRGGGLRLADGEAGAASTDGSHDYNVSDAMLVDGLLAWRVRRGVGEGALIDTWGCSCIYDFITRYVNSNELLI